MSSEDEPVLTDEEEFTYDEWLGEDDYDKMVTKAKSAFNTTMRLAGDNNMDAEDEARLKLHNLSDKSGQGLWRRWNVMSANDVLRAKRANNTHHRLPTPIEDCIKAINAVFKEYKPIASKAEKALHDALVTKMTQCTKKKNDVGHKSDGSIPQE